MRSIALCVLTLLLGGCAAEMPKLSVHGSLNQDVKVYWVDFDPACNENVLADPDDCIAYYLLRAGGLNIAGFSTVGGNVSADNAWDTARTLVNGSPLYRGDTVCDGTYLSALASEATARRISILALGPLTNVARFLECYPSLRNRIERIVFVGSRRPEQTFLINPDWITGKALKDLNVEIDLGAVETVLRSGVPVHYVPFEAALGTETSYGEFAHYTTLPEGVLERIRDWDMLFSIFFGTDGMLPFDPIAVAYVLWPNEFACLPVESELRGIQLVAELSEGDAGDSLYCLPKNPERVKAFMLSLLSSPLP